MQAKKAGLTSPLPSFFSQWMELPPCHVMHGNDTLDLLRLFSEIIHSYSRKDHDIGQRFDKYQGQATSGENALAINFI